MLKLFDVATVTTAIEGVAERPPTGVIIGRHSERTRTGADEVLTMSAARLLSNGPEGQDGVELVRLGGASADQSALNLQLARGYLPRGEVGRTKLSMHWPIATMRISRTVL
jgi:hypothetical protein